MPTDSVLFLHIGRHKTGSTSIQRYLADNRDLLGRQGLFVVRDAAWSAEGGISETERTNCTGLAHLLLRPELQTPKRLKGAFPAPAVPEAAARAVNCWLHARAGGRACILSSETFSFLRTGAERALLRIMLAGFDVIPIGFFRAPDAWLESWQAQLRQMQLMGCPEAAAGEGVFDFTPRSWLLQDQDIRAFFGPQGRYLSYEKAVAAQRSVLPAFLQEIGLAQEAARAPADLWLNSSPR